MTTLEELSIGKADLAKKHRLVVRLSTGVFKQGNKYVYQKTITPQKRKSTLSWADLVSDEQYDLPLLLSGNTQPDGLYELEATNFSHDWETGWVDGWDLQLIPFKEEQEN